MLTFELSARNVGDKSVQPVSGVLILITLAGQTNSHSVGDMSGKEVSYAVITTGRCFILGNNSLHMFNKLLFLSITIMHRGETKHALSNVHLSNSNYKYLQLAFCSNFDI